MPARLALLRTVVFVTACGGALALSSGCGGSPSQANIELRKQNQQLRDEIAQLTRQVGAQQAEIRGLKESNGTTQSLPQERLDGLVTTHSIRLGKLTGGADLQVDKPGHEALKVYVTPIDGTGEKIKAAGAFEVEAFDLSKPDNRRIGHWTLDAAAAAKSWNGFLTQYNYVLTLPWQTPPSHPSVTIKVTFTDALTGRKFTEQTAVNVVLPTAPPTAKAEPAP